MHRQDCMLFVHATNTVLCFQIVELCVFSLIMRTVSTASDKDVVIQSQLLKRCMHNVDRSYIMCLSRCTYIDASGYIERECKKKRVIGTRRCLRIYSPGSTSKY